MAVTARYGKRIKRDDRCRNDGLQERHLLQTDGDMDKAVEFLQREGTCRLLRRKQEELPLKVLVVTAIKDGDNSCSNRRS